MSTITSQESITIPNCPKCKQRMRKKNSIQWYCPFCDGMELAEKMTRDIHEMLEEDKVDQ